jgi:hypothetical protein
MGVSVELRVLTKKPRCGIPTRLVADVTHGEKDEVTVCISLPNDGQCHFRYAGSPYKYCRDPFPTGDVTQTPFPFRPTLLCSKSGELQTRLTATATNQNGQSDSDTKEVQITC